MKWPLRKKFLSNILSGKQPLNEEMLFFLTAPGIQPHSYMHYSVKCRIYIEQTCVEGPFVYLPEKQKFPARFQLSPLKGINSSFR